MSFLWPQFLWLGALAPLLLLAYLWLLKRRKRNVVAMSSLSVVREAAAGRSKWRRHVPPALILAAFSLLAVAMARPTAVITLPTSQQTIMLVMDVSASMKATDVSPNRLSASQEAAKQFVTQLPRGMRIGVVAYGGTAHLVQQPTTHHDDVLAAIDRFQLQPGTAIGSGIAVALATLLPQAGIDVASLHRPRGMRRAMPNTGMPADDLAAPATPVEPGSYDSGAIVLLTDGSNTAGIDPIDAAQLAASRGVKVYTVGFGTPEGVTITFSGWTMRVQLDEDTLRRIANLTHGQYFHAGDGSRLKTVYQTLTSRLLMEKRETEVTALFAMAGGLLMLLATALSLWWHGRIA